MTAAGVNVDADGCALDTDKDGVIDARDQCPDSPQGAPVDAQGCLADADNDGVPDLKDSCLMSPAGVTVDEAGCELDSDKDGLADSKDKCPDSPQGSAIDSATGCPPDEDSDGVADADDLCPETGSGKDVNVVGCARDENISLKGVNFKTASDELTPESLPILDAAVETLRRYPDITLRVAGHTDSRGDDAFNLNLSQKRATAVMKYLIGRGIAADMLTARGFGETRPIADNNSAEGQARNRRVELEIVK